MKNESRNKYGRLTVIERKGSNKDRHILWLCQCDCGKSTVVLGKNLRNGDTRSCGCLQKEEARQAHIQHGMCGTSTYISWAGLMQRCTNKDNPKYKYYGGRGIAVCSRWLKFENFYEDMGEKPNPKLTIERKNNDKGYSLENCKWATMTDQARNTRMRKDNKTGVVGVNWDRENNKYCVQIGANHELSDAIRARREGEIKYWAKQRGNQCTIKS